MHHMLLPKRELPEQTVPNRTHCKMQNMLPSQEDRRINIMTELGRGCLPQLSLSSNCPSRVNKSLDATLVKFLAAKVNLECGWPRRNGSRFGRCPASPLQPPLCPLCHRLHQPGAQPWEAACWCLHSAPRSCSSCWASPSCPHPHCTQMC